MSGLRRTFLALICLALFGLAGVPSALSQSGYHYMNEWYRFNQNYFKLRLSHDGAYRVSYSDLVTAGVPNLATLNPDKLQVIYRGKEISIRVKKTLGGELDYFEFEGRRNDGGIDSLMYRNPYPPSQFDPEQQPNRYSSFFTDTSAYFVTWDSSALLRRAVISPSNFSGRVPETSYRYRFLEEYKATYFQGGGGAADANHVLNSDYITGEGWVSIPFTTGDIPDVVARLCNIPGYVPGGPPSEMSARVFSVNSSNQHVLGISINNSEIYRDTTVGIAISTRNIETSLALTPQIVVRFQSFGNGNRPDKQCITYFTLEYNRDFDLGGLSRTIVRDWMSTDSSYFVFTNADVSAEAWIWDPVNNVHVNGVVSGDTLRFLVPGNAQARDLYVYTDKSLRVPIVVPQTKLSNLSDVNAGAEFLIITDQRFSNSASQYAQYRDTCSVNPLSSKVIFVDQIIDEFGYGSMTTMAIKHFVKYALDHWAVKPKYVMLWGKGRTNPRLESFANYVPSFGMPANDHEYVSNFDRDSVDLTPLAPIGRVSIFDDQQGLDYLAKVMEYEHMPYEGWMKNGVFLGGGKTPSEQSSIKDAIVNRFIPPLEDDPVGGKGYYYQNENNGITTNSTVPAHTRIDRGVGLIQFFGHSSTNIFDVDILEANRYLNFHKYPLMLAFGCYGGDFVQQGQSFGERFLLEPNRGSIGYLANTTEGFLGQLREYGLYLHRNLHGSQLGRPIGDVMRETIRQFALQGQANINILTANHCKQMDYQGDPSVVINLPQLPDLAIEEPKIWFSPEVLNAEDDFFDMNIVVENEGRTFTDTVVVRISQRLPSGLLFQHTDTLVGPVLLDDTLIVRLPNPAGRAMAGTNTFTVMVDALDSLQEYKESNNIVDKVVIVQGSTPALIYPYEFAIIGKDTLSLVASSYLVDRRPTLNYSFEIDTVHTFSSGFKVLSPTISGSSVNAEWKLPFKLQPGQVYFWRARFTDTYPVQWSEGSFKYIPGREGWSQSRIPQFFEDVTEALILDKINRSWKFEAFSLQLHALIHSFGGVAQNGRPDYFFGSYGSRDVPNPGIMFTTIDQHTLIPSVQNTSYGDWRFLASPTPSSPATIADLVTVISSMKDGDYLLMVTSDNASFPNWRPEYLQILAQIGVNPGDLATMKEEERAIVFGRKGAVPGTAIVVNSPNLPITGQSPQHDLVTTVTSTGAFGKTNSPWIGPAKSWSNLEYAWHPSSPMEQDSILVAVEGLSNADAVQTLRDKLLEGVHNLGSIDAGNYPRLRMHGTMKDAYHYSAPQMDKWEIYYQPGPDMAVDPNSGYSVPDTIEEGQIVHLAMSLRNLTNISTDSVLVRYTLLRADRSLIVLGEQTYAPMAGKYLQPLNFRFHSASKGLEEGPVTLFVDINPDDAQVEQNRFNNRYVTQMYVRTDKVGPILNVTVDGKHLMEGDIVQPSPEIVIEVNDENRYLPVSISDTTYFIWFGTERNYQFNQQLQISTDPRISATPGRMPENKAKLVFSPGRLPDGEYTMAVQSRDFKGNASGKAEYVIHFNVESDKAISRLLPYPNPFSTSTRFVYTLTGDEKPYVFELEIYTISGRLVKVIDLLALGEVNFGYNMTEYAWDGRDEFGDLLANGLYLYKTKVKFRDRYGVKQLESNLDVFFDNGFGKMYILR